MTLYKFKRNILVALFKKDYHIVFHHLLYILYYSCAVTLEVCEFRIFSISAVI